MSDKPTQVAIEIWSDVMCPWCIIGYKQLEKALNQMEGEVAAEIRWMPFELRPDTPPEGKSQARHIEEVYGRTPEQTEQMSAQMREAGERVGFPLEYQGEGPGPEPMMWNTFEAHKLLRWTLVKHGPEAQTRLKLALFRAHFRQRRNVGDRQVLLDIAAEQGLSREEAADALADEALGTAVRLDEMHGRQAEITAIPTFVVNGRYLIQGARDPEYYRKALRKVAAAH